MRGINVHSTHHISDYHSRFASWLFRLSLDLLHDSYIVMISSGAKRLMMFFSHSREHPVGVKDEQGSAYGETSRFDNGGYFGGDGPLMILCCVYVHNGGK